MQVLLGFGIVVGRYSIAEDIYEGWPDSGGGLWVGSETAGMPPTGVMGDGGGVGAIKATTAVV